MQTMILDARADLSGSVRAAVEVLRRNSLVSIPTETVYGLAANALEPEAVAKIFEAKERPYFDPLIIHVAQYEWLSRLVQSGSAEMPLIRKLIERFWPGPLTILFPKTPLVPDIVTAGSQQVAVRMPNHTVFLDVLRMLGKPLAAPSANRFGKVSPTRPEHVFEELKGKIPLILDAGPTTVGVESTIVRVVENRIEILRPGPITEELLNEFAPASEFHGSDRIIAPGQSASHYAPAKPVYLLNTQEAIPHTEDSALLCWGPVRDPEKFSAVRSLSENYDFVEAAQRLFELLRELDRLESLKAIFVEPVPEEGLGKAIMNRIRRAASPRIADLEGAGPSAPS
jgi:L-threonylcarbamoyladenylate synthase